MVDTTDKTVLDLPKVYLVRMMVFTLIVGIIAAVLYPSIERAFQANVGLNGLIIGGAAARHSLFLPDGLAAMARDQLGQSLPHRRSGLSTCPIRRACSPPWRRCCATGRAARCSARCRCARCSIRSPRASTKRRDISRYLVGLLIFLGLLGTFWGLLETVTSVGDAIKALGCHGDRIGHRLREPQSRPRASACRHGPFVFVIALRPGRIADPRLPRTAGKPGAEPVLYRSRRLALDHHRYRSRRESALPCRIISGSIFRACKRASSASTRRLTMRWARSLRRPPAPAALVRFDESLDRLAGAVANLVTKCAKSRRSSGNGRRRSRCSRANCIA